MKNKWIGIATVFCIYMICAQIIWGVNMPNIQSEGAILIEAKTNTVLYSKNANQKFYPASITKLLTALICEEQLNNNTIITKTKEAVKTVPSDSSHIGLQIGDSFSKEAALYGLLLGSDNFIAHDLAITEAGSIKDFAKKMNQKAKQLGAINTHFTNPHGYHDKAHYTTPYDMAQIAKGVFSNEKITQIAGTRNYKFKANNNSKVINIKNTSKLLDPTTSYYNPNVIGTKTGWHDDAGQTLVAKATYNDMELIAVTMKTRAPNQYKDINALFEYGFKNFNVINEEGKYRVENRTYSSFGEPFVKYAKEQGWNLPGGKNYQEPLNYSEFIDVLGYIWGRSNVREVLNEYTFKNPLESISRKEAAYILHQVLTELGTEKNNQETNLFVPDIEDLNMKYQEAIYYTIGNKILGANEQPFKPEGILSYEQALCIAYRIQTVGMN